MTPSARASTWLTDRYTEIGFHSPVIGSFMPRRSLNCRSEKLVLDTTAEFLKMPMPAKPVDNTEPRSLSGMDESWLSSVMQRGE